MAIIPTASLLIRHDRSLQDHRMKLFPKKKTGEGSNKSTRTGSPPGGGKEKSQLSFYLSSPGASKDKIPVLFALTPCEPKKSEITVEYIQKYVANKFGQVTDNDVEIKLMGETLLPDLLLGEAMRVWANDMVQAAHFKL